MAEPPLINPIGATRNQRLADLLRDLADYYASSRAQSGTQHELTRRAVRRIITELLEDWL